MRAFFYADETPATVDTATRSYYETSTKGTVRKFGCHNTSELKIRNSQLTTQQTPLPWKTRRHWELQKIESSHSRQLRLPRQSL